MRNWDINQCAWDSKGWNARALKGFRVAQYFTIIAQYFKYILWKYMAINCEITDIFQYNKNCNSWHFFSCKIHPGTIYFKFDQYETIPNWTDAVMMLIWLCWENKGYDRFAEHNKCNMRLSATAYRPTEVLVDVSPYNERPQGGVVRGDWSGHHATTLCRMQPFGQRIEETKKVKVRVNAMALRKRLWAFVRYPLR
jgi:hypothetical protein